MRPRALRWILLCTGAAATAFFVHAGRADGGAGQGLPLVQRTLAGANRPGCSRRKTAGTGWRTRPARFLLAVPDSPENIWFLERDGGVFARMIDRLHSRYGIDRERVYLTGFSNGGMMTREAGTRYPQLFAALSPWNAPPAETWPGFAEGGWQMPCFIYLDNDPVARGTEELLLEQMLGQTVVRLCGRPGLCAGCDTQRRKPLHCRAWVYRGRTLWHSEVYRDAQGVPRVCVTVMKKICPMERSTMRAGRHGNL